MLVDVRRQFPFIGEFSSADFLALDRRTIRGCVSFCGDEFCRSRSYLSLRPDDRRLRLRPYRDRPVGTDAHHRRPAKRTGRSDDVAAGGRTRTRSRDRRARQPAGALCEGIGHPGVVRRPDDIRRAGVLAGFFRNLDAWRDSLRRDSRDHAAVGDRASARRPFWRSATQITAIAARSCFGPSPCNWRYSCCCRSC